ncbi:MAG TPA: hypothetical protein VM694_18565 [Polyangium sp.]|nr:hypothetical protein [Polyangium sp.]
MTYVKVVVDKKLLGILAFSRLPRIGEHMLVDKTLYRVTMVVHTPQREPLTKKQTMPLALIEVREEFG